MSTSWKISIGAVLVVAVIGGVMLYRHSDTSVASTMDNTSESNMQAHMQTNTMSNSANDTSDAALSQDMTSLDAHMKTVDSNSADTDQSFKDQPVSQTE